MRRLSLCFTLILLTVRAMAIDAVVCHTVYYKPGPNGTLVSYVDISWQVNQNTLHYLTTPEKTIVGHVKATITLSNKYGELSHDEFVFQTVPVYKIDQIIQHSIMGKRKYDVPAGMVKMKFTLTDVSDSLNHFISSDSFTVAPPTDSFFFSGIELLDTAYKSDKETSFQRGGMQHIPLSTNFLDDKRSMFYYYAELYCPGNISASDYPLIQTVCVSKSATEGYYADLIKKDTITAWQRMSRVFGRFNIPILPSGNYYVRVSLENKGHEEIASGNLYIQRFNKHPAMLDSIQHNTAKAFEDTGMEKVTVLNLKKTFVAKYTLAEVRSILKMLLPVSDPAATKTINGFLKKPDEIYMRYFIYNHFLAINKDDPERAWKEFAEKVTKVNKLFTAGSKIGYETERGYIYLRYGPPTDIITVDNEQGSLPYEIWQYNTLTQTNGKDIPNALFLFYRPNEFTDDYRLLHSTVEGEVENPQWRSTLFVNGGRSPDSFGSRAEEYIGNR